MSQPSSYYARRTVERTLSKLPEPHRGDLQAWLLVGEAVGTKPNSLASRAVTFEDAVRFLPEKRVAQWTEQDALRWLPFLRGPRDLAEYTVHNRIGQLKAYLRFADPESRAPDRMNRLLKLRRPRPTKDYTPLSAVEIQRLVSGTASVRDRALVRFLHDSGLRISELVSLNVGCLVFNDDGTALVSLPQDGIDLKTGARIAVIRDSVADLQAWLQQHPCGNDPAAPLFVSMHRQFRQRVSRGSINTYLRGLAVRTGVRHVWPYLLRHSRATEYGRANIHLSKMNVQFGWSKTSKMGLHYTSPDHTDVQRDLLALAPLGHNRPGAQPTGSSAAHTPQSDDVLAAAVAGIVQLLRRMSPADPRDQR